MNKSDQAETGAVLPRIISDVEILQRVSFDAGPRIGRVQRIEYRGTVSTVNFWYNNDGSLHHVA